MAVIRPSLSANPAAGQDPVHESVLRLYQSVGAARELERSHHAQGVERELLEELARTVDVGQRIAPGTEAEAGIPWTNGERMAAAA